MKCRFCNTELSHEFIDLVNSPPSNAYLTKDALNLPETFFPLKLFVCHSCFLVQIDEYKESKQIFDSNYSYFSSYSTTWLQHCQVFVNQITERLDLNASSKVIEIASNDGYLLQYFKEKNIPCTGIEPTSNTAKVAVEKGIETIVDFFGYKLAQQLRAEKQEANLIIGNNVLAHVPNINDFLQGLKELLAPSGTITLEFPHLLQLIEHNQFDTIYHEHYSYISLFALQQIAHKHGLAIYDTQELPTHGGSLRAYMRHKEYNKLQITNNVERIIENEKQNNLNSIEGYLGFQEKAEKIKQTLTTFLLEQQREGKKVIAYGAAAKGNTLLNYCGIKKDLIDFVVDKSPHKQNKYMPASHIPIVDESEILKHKPDFVLILPWNIKDEIIEQLGYVREWGARFVVPIPELSVL